LKANSIISRAESMQILANDLRRAALEKRAAELKEAIAETREAILAEIQSEIRKQLRRRARTFGGENVIFRAIYLAPTPERQPAS
jgi:hypothetical protein